MTPYNDFTWSEINSQPDAWAATLDLLAAQQGALRGFARDAEQVVFTGCGSTYYLALAAAASLRELAGVPAVGLPASEVWLNPAGSFPGGRRTLLVALSRSGATSETLRAIAAFQAAARGPVLTLSCYPEQPMARMGDMNLVLAAGQEQSIAQTRAFTTLQLGALGLALAWAGRDDLWAELGRLPAAARGLLASYRALALELGGDAAIERCFFLGSGARYGLACELSLKMKEMSLSESEPFHFLEYRHGPQSMARPGTLIVGLLSDTHRSHEQAVLSEMRALGARVVALAAGDAEVSLGDVAEPVRGPLYLPFGQMLAYERAIARGLTPDRPNQLSAVVMLDG
ncbi:SIS domain-containing protein [Kouleothrix sp.]|uniref:SIS domain-containing protein n=1 Tax=Kouleothrix sp. TaxID=2779161 RepID=UPI00391BB12B